MMKLKKGFAVAMAAGVLTTGGLGMQATVFSATAFAQPPGAGGSAEEDEDENGEYPIAETAVGGEEQGGEEQGGEEQGQEAVLSQFTPANFAKIPAKATLTIHKFSNEGDNKAKKNNGTVQTDVVGDKVPGVTFTVQQIGGIDLGTNAGWVAAEELAKNFKTQGEAALTGAHALTGTATEMDATDSNGETSKKFPRGLYLVKETAVPDNYEISVKPFIVALPLTDPDKLNGWLENVHVYPKNQKKEAEATKTVKDASLDTPALIEGTENQYTITQALTKGNRYNGMRLVDFYPEARLEYVADSAVVKLNGAALEGGDYNVDTTTTGQVVITLTQAGLTKVNAKRNEAGTNAVTAELKFKVLPTPSNEAVAPVVNKFKTWTSREEEPPTDPNDNTPPTVVTPPTDTTTPPPTDEENPPAYPKSYYGNVKINKKGKNEAGNLEPLAGAVFDLHTCDADPVDSELTTATKIRADITTNGTDDPEIKGLLANNYRDGAAVDATNSYYCLVETKAPAGFELLAQPLKFQVLADDSKNTVALVSDEVINVTKNGGFDLPLTGGKGVFALLLAGAAFLVLGRGYSVYAGRRNKA